MEGLRLDIVTPDKVVLNAEVDYVGACGVDGQFGLLPQHAPMLSALKVGELYYRQQGLLYDHLQRRQCDFFNLICRRAAWRVFFCRK